LLSSLGEISHCLAFPPYLQADLVDIAYHPIFQSGGEYKLEPFASSNDDPVDYGVIICQAGARYVESTVYYALFETRAYHQREFEYLFGP